MDDKVLIADAKKIVSFESSHLVMGCVIALAIIVAIHFYDVHKADQADARAAVAEAEKKAADDRAAASDQQNKVFQQQVQQQLTDLRQEKDSLKGEVQQLKNTMAARDAQYQQALAAIPTMTQDAVGQAITGKLSLPPADAIQSTSEGGYKTTRNAGNAILGSIQERDKLRADNADLNTEVGQKDKIITNTEQQLALEGKSHQSDNSTCTLKLTAKDADIIAANAERDKAKADAKKNGWKKMLLGGFILELLRYGATGKL